MEPLWYKDPAHYLGGVIEYLRDADPEAPVPVLAGGAAGYDPVARFGGRPAPSTHGPGPASHGDLEREALLLARRLPGTNCPVVAQRDDPFLAVAAVHAVRHGRPLQVVDDLQGLCRVLAQSDSLPGSVTIAAHPALLDAPALYRLQLAAERGGSRGAVVSVPYGVLTGASLASASLLPLKSSGPLPLSGEDVLLFGCTGVPTVHQDGVLHVLDRAAVQREGLHWLRKSTIRCLGAYGHGNEDIVYCGPDVLCSGCDAEPGGVAATARVPHCRRGHPCHRALRDHLGVQTLRAEVVALFSCLGVAPAGNNLEAEASIGMRALDGWARAVVASFRTHFARPPVLTLFLLLLNSGRPLGECVLVCNNAVVSARDDLPPFLLAGDPELRFVPRPAAAQALASVPVPPGLEGADLYLTAEDAGEASAGATEFALVPEGGGWTALAWGAPGSTAPPRLKVTTVPPVPGHILRAASSFAADYKVLETINRPAAAAAKGQASQVTTLAVSLSRALSEARHTVRGYEQARRSGARLRTAYLELGRSVMRHLLSRTAAGSLIFLDDYRAAFDVEEQSVLLEEASPCGHPATRCLLRLRLGPPARRETVSCSRCGVVVDRPWGGPLRLEIDSGGTIRDGVVAVRLVAHNQGGDPLEGWIGAAAELRGSRGGVWGPEHLTLGPGERWVQSIPWPGLEGLPPDVYLFSAYACIGLELYQSQRFRYLSGQ
ncbi:MAG: hypothetical protein K6T75_02980 [Acetobacteraceae bacterium]|nr:hypothetical protein [Acetobacteraceae bacterium]